MTQNPTKMQYKITSQSSILLFFAVIFFDLVQISTLPLSAGQQEFFQNFSQTMEVNINDADFTYSGTGRTEFTNKSGDTLHALFFHTFFNAFQPGSAMSERSNEIGDNEIGDKISKLKPQEYGKLEITSGEFRTKSKISIERTGTIIRIDLSEPILPDENVAFSFKFSGQVPLQTRRGGRTNSQGVRYSMAQWYPKLCQYDESGWHNNQYVAREFYGVWGKYDVKITLPAKFVVGASGELQNPASVGHGYEFTSDTTIQPEIKLKSIGKENADTLLTWHFVASPVHDFAWVADADYVHTIVRDSNLTIHLLYKPNVLRQWHSMPDWCKRTIHYFGNHYGNYPYKTFTCSQAGDGGMEYPQLIMIQHRPTRQLLEVTVHEIGHQWFYGLVANNETKHAWMDEGMNTFIEHKILNEEFYGEAESKKDWLTDYLIPKQKQGIKDNGRYWSIAGSGREEPQSLPHDRFRDGNTSAQVYSKGAAILHQLEYSFGRQAVDSMMKIYAMKWRFKHPYPRDFEKTCEEVFGQRLDEFFETFLLTTENPLYRIESLKSEKEGEMWRNHLTIRKFGAAHVPLNLLVENSEGKFQAFHVPSDILMRKDTSFLPIWFWTNPKYSSDFLTYYEPTAVRLDTSGKLLTLHPTWAKIHSSLLENFPNSPDFELGLWKRYDLTTPLDYVGISVRPTVWYFAKTGLQLGLRADVSKDKERNFETFGLYFNLRSNSFEGQFRANYPVGEYHLNFDAMKMDGVQEFGLKIIQNSRQSLHGASILGWLMAEYWNFNTSNGDFPFFAKSSSGEFMKFSGVEKISWNGGMAWAQGIVSANSIGAGGQLNFEAKHSGWISNLMTFGWRIFTTAGTPNLPEEMKYSLQSGTAIDRFENVPSRYSSFLPVKNSNLRMLLSGGGGLIRSNIEPFRFLTSFRINFDNYSILKSIKIPILENLKVGMSSAVSLASHCEIFGNFSDNFYSDSGFSARLNLNDIFPASNLLWLFTDELSATIYLPIVSKQPFKDWKTQAEGIWLGISREI